MVDNWTFKFRYALSNLQREYQISDRIIINSLSDAIHGVNIRSRGNEFRFCKVRISFDNSMYDELPFHSGCYGILRDIIEDEIEKSREGFGLPKTEFLTRLCILVQLISMIEKDWKIKERTQQEFADYFNDLVQKATKRISSSNAPSLCNGFLKRWNKLYNLQWELERSVHSCIPPKEKRRRITPVVDQPTAPSTFDVSSSSMPPPHATPNFSSSSSQNLFGSSEEWERDFISLNNFS